MAPVDRPSARYCFIGSVSYGGVLEAKPHELALASYQQIQEAHVST